MAPPKASKKEVPKHENGANNKKIDDPINTDSWKCVVVMAVEKTRNDRFVLQEFIEESSNGRRQEISLIDFDTFVMKLLNDFERGELPYKYAFLLNFTSVFQEAIGYVSKKIEIPVVVLAKIVKALLFYLREESLMKIKKAGSGFPDPIKAMAERPINFGIIDTKNKEMTKKGDNGLKVRPPSITKQDTTLLKRGEKANDNERIDDAPENGYFSLYVLLTGFYNPNFPLELIKTGIPLHALLCIDTSFSGVKRGDSFTRYKAQKQNLEIKSHDVQNFWNEFLKILWDPKVIFYFKDIIFQVYLPQRLLCGKKKLREFIYREISYLMYDLSDLKRQLCNYLDHLRLWDVTEKEFDMAGAALGLENLSNECVTVPTVLQFIIDAICRSDRKHQLSSSYTTLSTRAESEQGGEFLLSRDLTELETSIGDVRWSQKLEEKKDFNLLNIYFKTKELDIKYDLNAKGVNCTDSEESFNDTENSQGTCNFHPSVCSENMEEALLSSDGIFRSYWKNHQKNFKPIFNVDYCLYSLLMTRVMCRYQVAGDAPQPSPVSSCRSYRKNSIFELIENLSKEMRRPHFTITDGSRNIIKTLPYNVKNTPRDFFCPEHLKIVSPEKLKASSAPEFRVTPNLEIQTIFKSEIFPLDIEAAPYETLRGFIDDCLFSNTNGFDLLEFLSKPKLLEKEYKHWNNYNCIDQSYSLLNDCILIVLHNRKDKQNIYHETFNKALRTPVGLRDFYEYVTEDESEWLKIQDELYKSTVFLSNRLLETNGLRSFTASDFWLVDSIKYKNFRKNSKELDVEVKTAPSKTEKITKRPKIGKLRKPINPSSEFFEGYDISDTAVQFSGLKTEYYATDCRLTVQLTEKLYGNQELGIHVTTSSHTLHLYSYVCPEPHILHPFTFHLTYKNGIIIAFGRRLIETFEEIEEIIESRTAIKGKKNSSELSTRIIKKLIPRTVKDEEFIHDMVASLPNGLSVRTVRKILKPCYIKQHYQANRDRPETSRLVLPNGNVVKMMRNGAVEILRVDTSIVTASLSDLIRESDTGNLNFTKFDITSGEGYGYTFEQGDLISSKRFPVFQNTDVDTGQVFYRRRDGTNYMLQNDGTLCVQFKDGTKVSSSILELTNMLEPSLNEETFEETNIDADFVFIHTEITAEHPDYATVVYDTMTQIWRILLPFDSTVTVKPNGHFTVDINKQTELDVKADFIQMKNFSCDRKLQNSFTADLSVFENKENGLYCRMEGSNAKTFIVEKNSNCYILDNEENPQEIDSQDGSTIEILPLGSKLSEFVASMDLQVCPSIRIDKNTKLVRENKYFVIKRDITGVELFHVDDVKKELEKLQKKNLVYTQNIPNTGNRCFVLLTPRPKKKAKKWAVDTILPNPKYDPSANKKTVSSTYGIPPSWMHPFPKRKIKFVVPEPLTCRVFVETKKTDLSPQVGALDYYNCEIDDIIEVKHSRIPAGRVEEYFQKLSNDDQDILKEMYTLAAASLINEKKRLKPINSEKLERYLEMSKYIVELREYHKRCIRHQIVPNYFHHPAGMSWLILNELLEKLKLPVTKTQRHVPMKSDATFDESSRSLGSASEFSHEEIEYNLSPGAGQSFSDLSFRSNLSAQTAPAELITRGVCRCKVREAKSATSSPFVKCYWTDQTFSEPNLNESHSRICYFQEDDIEMIEKREYERRKMAPMTLEDLMHLGLI